MSAYQSDWVVGIDVGDRRSHMCRLNTRTGEILEDRIPTRPQAFDGFFKALESRSEVASVVALAARQD